MTAPDRPGQGGPDPRHVLPPGARVRLVRVIEYEIELDAPAASAEQPSPPVTSSRDAIREAIVAVLREVPRPVKSLTLIREAKPRSRTTFHRALHELIDAGAVVVPSRGYYWLAERGTPPPPSQLNSR